MRRGLRPLGRLGGLQCGGLPVGLAHYQDAACGHGGVSAQRHRADVGGDRDKLVVDVRRVVDGREDQLHVSPGLHIVRRLYDTQVDVPQRDGADVALVPFTAGSWVAVWDTCPALQPDRTTAAAAIPHAASLKRFTQTSWADEATVLAVAVVRLWRVVGARLGAVAKGLWRLDSYLEAVTMAQQRARKPPARCTDSSPCQPLLFTDCAPDLHR